MTNTQGTCDGGLRKSFEVYNCFPIEYEWGPFPRGVPGQILLAGNSRDPGALVVPVGQAEHKPHPHLSWQRLQQMTPLLLVQGQEALDWVFDPWMLYFGLIVIHSLADGIQWSKALQDPKGGAHGDPGCSGAPTGLEKDFFQALFENSPVISTQLVQSWVTCPDSAMQSCRLCFPWFLYRLHETGPEHRRR